MEIKTFTLVNAEKVDRALNGSTMNGGNRSGGIGAGAYFEAGVWKRDGDEISQPEVDKLESALLAEYDRLGGFIKRGSDKVKTGSFYDFKAKEPRKVAKVVFIYRVNGKTVEVADGTELPGEVKAVKILEEAAAKGEEIEQDEAPVKKSKKSKK